MFKSKKNFCKRAMRILLIAVVGTGIMMFTGCGTAAENEISYLGINDTVSIWTDDKTGVQILPDMK